MSPEPPSGSIVRMTRAVAVLGALAAVAALVVALVVAGGWGLLVAVNPVADEWLCSQGRAPAHHRSGGGDCFREGRTLPEGYRWDRWGNRPMPHNCDEDGWVKIATRDDNRTDCVREGTELPARWRPVDW